MKKIIINILYKLISLIDYIDYHYIKKEKLIDNYKTIEEINLNNIEILTDTGYKKLSHLMISKPFEIYNIKLENGYELDCADEHKVFDENFNEIFVKDLYIGQYIQTDNGLQKLISISKSLTKISMCDTTVNDENHRFYSNGILSHNSVTTAIFCLWVILFNTNKAGLILSKSGPAGKELLKKVKDMYLYLPYYLKCGTVKWNISEISFDNNSSIATEAFSPTAGLGNTINFLILDEFAWCPPNDVELFYMNIIPVITADPTAQVCIMSTQNGFNLFYKLWRAAVEKKSDYAPFKVDWYQVPEYNAKTGEWEKRTEAWKKKMIGVLGSEEAFNYQYSIQFSASDKCLVSRECLSEINKTSELWTNRIDDLHNAGISLFLNYPDMLFWASDFDFDRLRDSYFLVCCDLSEGSGQDYIPFNIFMLPEKDKFIHVGRWYSNEIDLDMAALEFWLLMGQLFNSERCIWSIEWNTYGALFYKTLLSLNEPDYDEKSLYRFNICKEGLETANFCWYKKTNIEEEIIGKAKHTSNHIPGIKFTSGNKGTACSLLKMLLEKKQVITTDLITINELENFEDKNGNGSYKAAFGHDDSIMTFVQIPMVQQTTKYKYLVEEIEAGTISQQIENNWFNRNIYNNFNTGSYYNTQGQFDIFT